MTGIPDVRDGLDTTPRRRLLLLGSRFVSSAEIARDAESYESVPRR